MYILIIYVEYPAVMLPLDNGSKFIDPLSNGSMCFQIKREKMCVLFLRVERMAICAKFFWKWQKKERVQTREKSVYYSCSLFPVCFTLLLWEEVYRISLFFSNLLLCGELE